MDTFAHLLMPNYGEEEESSSSIQLDGTFAAASSTSSIDGHFHTTRTSSSLTRRPSYLKPSSRSGSLLSSGIGWGKRALSVLVETGCGEQHAEAVASLDDDEYFPGRDDVAAALRPYKFCSTKGSSLLRTRTWSSTTTCSTEESNLSDEETTTTSSSWSSSLQTREANPDESEGASAATSWTTEVQESADADDGNEKCSGGHDDEIRVSTDDSSTLESKGDANTVLSDATTVRASGSCPAWIIEVLDGNLQELSVSEPIRFRLFRPGNLSFTVLEGAEILGRIQSLLDSTPDKRLVFCLNFRRARRKLWLHADEIMDELRDILGRCGGAAKNKPSCPKKQQSSNSLFFARRRRNFDFHDATRSVMSHCTTAFEGRHHHGKYWIGRRMRSSFGSKISNRCEV